jgi:hypothetical protein
MRFLDIFKRIPSGQTVKQCQAINITFDPPEGSLDNPFKETTVVSCKRGAEEPIPEQFLEIKLTPHRTVPVIFAELGPFLNISRHGFNIPGLLS